MLKKTRLFPSNDRGVLKCARYAFMPNKLRLCGPDKQRNLFEYCQTEQVDRGLNLILKNFQTLYPYLKFIARMNYISDPFDERVVEAYWIGNELLEGVSRSRLYYHLTDGLELKKKLNKKSLNRLADGVRLGAKPHHNFHVLAVWKRTGHLPVAHTLATMELCRISWGRVKKVNQRDIAVEYSPLILDKDKLKLGQPIVDRILYKIDDRGFVKTLQRGNWISFHWGFACEALSDEQVKNLSRYTKESIFLINELKAQ